MKEKVKKGKIFILVIFILIITGIIVLFVKNKNNTMVEISETGEKTFIIKSTGTNRIEKDNIEAEKITINVFDDQLEVKTVLKNNKSEDLNGYLIEIDLLDKDGNIVSTISDNSSDTIKPSETKEIINYVNGIENFKDIVNARFVSIEESSISNTLENAFDDIKQDIEIEENQE